VIAPTGQNANPRLGGASVVNIPATGTTGAFTVTAPNLTPGTAYIYASYATNGAGTAYSSLGAFTTLSNEATLSALSLDAGALAPAFAAGTLNYTASVSNASTTLRATATTTHPDATLIIHGQAAVSGTPSDPITLIVGENAIPMIVTAQDGVTTKTYTIQMKRRSKLEDWRLQHFELEGNTGAAADLADFDRDGLPNLLEFHSGTNPRKPSVLNHSLTMQDNELVFTYRRSKASVSDGTMSLVEWSDTFLNGNWNSASVNETVTDQGEMELVTARVPRGSHERFVRLKVSRP
jgi:hypothetical protein